MSNEYLNGNAALNIQEQPTNSDLNQFPYVESHPLTSETNHTFTNQENVYHDYDELMELSKASGQDYDKLIAYNPKRLALHEAIISVSTMVRTSSHKEMQELVRELYASSESDIKILSNSLENKKAKISESLTSTINALSNGESIEDSPYAEEIKTGWELVEARINSGEYNPEKLSKEEAVKSLVLDGIFKQKAETEIQKLIEKKVQEKIQDPNSKFEAIELPQSAKDRVTLFLCGGAAAGKSTSVSKMKQYATEQLGVKNCKDVVRINTDYYRELLEGENFSFMPSVFADFTHDESSEIGKKIFARLNELKKQDKCPHVLFDQVKPKQDRLDFAKGGKAYCQIIYRDPRKCLKSAYSRGLKTRRFVPTVAALLGHKEVVTSLPKILADNIGEDIRIEIIDNANGAQKIFCADLKNNKVIYNGEASLKEFIRNTCINEKAKTKEDLYDLNNLKEVKEYFSPFEKARESFRQKVVDFQR